MSKKVTILMLPLIAILLSWSGANKKSSADEIRAEKALIKLVNDHRKSIGMSELVRSKTADRLAEEHATYMVTKKNVNHDHFDERLEALETTEKANNVSENVGVENTEEKAKDAYLNSFLSKMNIEGDFTHTGIAVKKDAKGNYFYAQIFYNK